ncbi:TnsA endonuclease N-terminal domain-containing protein [Pseudomonas aeruginosa]|uniref:TnsA endonuclease N-terminal domain-containing protein n=1 Tax=Pseudomonas aeruginosa TaxID=287 RepID=UPI002AFECE62|nr:TnsA endonuclease N-terminal domain-containing protein [Pseudomonas aeruginosa]
MNKTRDGILEIGATGQKMDRNSCDQPLATQTRRIKATRRSLSGFYPYKGEPIPFESTLERDFLKRIAFWVDVERITAQPACINFVARNGRPYQYTPDYLVQFRNDSGIRPMLVEVKPEEDWRENWRNWLPKWKAAWRYAQERGWSFRIFDESRIRDQVLENIVFLERHVHMVFPPEETTLVLRTISEMGEVPLHYLLALHFSGFEREGTSHLWHLLATRKIECDICRPLDEFTLLWSPT